MSDCLKLTTYGGERARVDGRFAADVVLELYERHEIATSILLRGAQGFGVKHHLRTDRLLTLSEDLPLVSIAVDRRPKIEALVRDLRSVKRYGLVTLERARMLAGDDLVPVVLPHDVHEETKLTVYVGRQDRVDGAPAHLAICDLLHRRGIAGATTLLGVDGTAHGRRQRARFFGRNADVPEMVIAVGDGRRIAAVLADLRGLLRRPLVTVERVTVCKRDGRLLAPPTPLPATDERGLGLWQKLTVYSSESALHDGVPIHAAILRRLRATGARGATSLRGVWGFHGDHRPHGDRLLQLRRRVPVVTVVVDRPDQIARSFAVIDEITAESGLVTSEMVPALAAMEPDGHRGGFRLAQHGA